MAVDSVFVALGSNLGDREAHLEEAVRALASSAGIELLAVSPVYETAPIGPPPQGHYLNAVLRLRTTLAPRALLERQLEIEACAGRERGERDAARTLDVDLLLFGARVVNEPGLVVPHPRMVERAFVLEPLCDLAPEFRHPTLGLTIEELVRRVRDPAAVKRYRGFALGPTGRRESTAPPLPTDPP
jgi:2-amino-4-hydroxy-6-hydroxymethyldihydropteridine diphosphokinase